MQTKLGSFVEACSNIAVGFSVNWCANMAILPLFGFHVTGGVAFEIGLWFTAVSLARQYVLRRWFNGLKFGNVPKSGITVPKLSTVIPNTGSVLPADAAARNEFPMYDGLLAYFPAALAAVARVSKIGNDQHNPGEPLGWARAKSTDHKNKIIRHLLDGDGEDTDGTLHVDKLAWRALANAQTVHESRGAPLAPASR